MEVYIVYDAALASIDVIRSVHSSLALAEIAKNYYVTEALNDIINDDPKETGIGQHKRRRLIIL